jgi:hypothetical protein
MDTIHAGMARLRQLKITYAQRSEKHQISVSQEFLDTWCRNNVFCSGCLVALKWRLTPALSFCPPSLLEDLGPL